MIFPLALFTLTRAEHFELQNLARVFSAATKRRLKSGQLSGESIFISTSPPFADE